MEYRSLNQVVCFTALLKVIPAIFLPFILAFLFEKTEGVQLNWSANRKMLLVAGVSYAFIYLVTSFLTIEYVSVLAGAIGLWLFVWMNVSKNNRPTAANWLQIFFPYLLFVVLLIATKIMLSDSKLYLGEHIKPISLYQPGIIFILTAILYYKLSYKKEFLRQHSYLPVNKHCKIL